MEPQDNIKEQDIHTAASGSSHSQSQPRKRGASHKKKKLSLKKKIFIGAVLLIFFILLAGWGYLNHLLGKINPMDSATISAEDFVEETDAFSDDPDMETLSPEEITLQLASQVLKDKDVLNILLIGQDTQPGVSGSRSDSMILATVNQKKKEITITSFMRDLYVDIPGYKKSRINAAYAIGGVDLLNETIERNFGIHIDGNIAVNFTGFAKCIDIIGGVDMELSAAEAGAVNKELYASQRPIVNGTDLQADRWALMGGFQHLSGDEALQYARIREIDSDFSRTNRQRKLLAAVFEKLKNSDLKTINALLEEVLPLISTDISNTKLIGYAAGVLAMQPAAFKTDRIPADGAFREAVVHHMQVLVPDLEKNQLHLKESLYGSDSAPDQTTPASTAPDRQEKKPSRRPAAAQPAAPKTAAPANPGAVSQTAGSPYGTSDGLSQGNEGRNQNPYDSSPSEESSGYGYTDEQSSSYQYGPGMPAAPAATEPVTEPVTTSADDTAAPSAPEPVIESAAGTAAGESAAEIVPGNSAAAAGESAAGNSVGFGTVAESPADADTGTGDAAGLSADAAGAAAGTDTIVSAVGAAIDAGISAGISSGISAGAGISADGVSGNTDSLAGTP